MADPKDPNAEVKKQPESGKEKKEIDEKGLDQAAGGSGTWW